MRAAISAVLRVRPLAREGGRGLKARKPCAIV
jgi:hypothetical protein